MKSEYVGAGEYLARLVCSLYFEFVADVIQIGVSWINSPKLVRRVYNSKLLQPLIACIGPVNTHNLYLVKCT